MSDNIRGLNALAQETYANALRHDWWKPRLIGGVPVPRQVPEILMLIHSEVSEAGEEWRDGREPDEVYFKYPSGETGTSREDEERNLGKPEGIPIELADVIIRTLDACAYLGIDIETAMALKMEYNRTRPTNHGRRI